MMGTTFDFAIDLMHGGFASSVALVLFVDAAMRRVLMAVGLACVVVGILVISLLGPVRTSFLLVILYFYHGHFREERAQNRRAETIGAAVSDVLPDSPPDSTGAKPRGSCRRRPGCSDR
ncbi:MAG: hypothetical protein O3A96_13955 [Proteobacteria bacterium]|nr:hypothetical protein [Pseudomonadota bacterium]